MLKVQIVRAAYSHIPEIAASARESDRQELHAIACVTPVEGLRISLEASCAAWTAMVNGSPVCMFGVCPEGVLAGVGVPWMIGTHELDKHPVTLLRRCRPFLAEMFKCCVLLQNYVDARNTTSIQWLKWLGFRIEEARPAGPFGLPFHRFELRRGVFMGRDAINCYHVCICLHPLTFGACAHYSRKARKEKEDDC